MSPNEFFLALIIIRCNALPLASSNAVALRMSRQRGLCAATFTLSPSFPIIIMIMITWTKWETEAYMQICSLCTVARKCKKKHGTREGLQKKRKSRTRSLVPLHRFHAETRTRGQGRKVNGCWNSIRKLRSGTPLCHPSMYGQIMEMREFLFGREHNNWDGLSR